MYFAVIFFGIMSPFMFATLAVVLARPSSIMWGRVRRAFLALSCGLAVLFGIPAVLVTAWFVIDTGSTRPVAVLLPFVALLGIGVIGLTELLDDRPPSQDTGALET